MEQCVTNDQIVTLKTSRKKVIRGNDGNRAVGFPRHLCVLLGNDEIRPRGSSSLTCCGGSFGTSPPGAANVTPLTRAGARLPNL